MEKCRLCGNGTLSPFLPDLRSEGHETYSLRRCRRCSFVTLAPIPDDVALRRYYDLHYWNQEAGPESRQMDLLFSLRMGHIVRELKSILPPGSRLLDWGTGDGSLVRLFVENGLDAYGIDSYSRSPDGKRVFRSALEDAPFEADYFDCITCFHVLEHLADPVGSVKAAFNLLKPGGIMVCEVPNISSGQFRLFGRRWQPLEIPFHLNHFNPESLSRLFAERVHGIVIRRSFFSHRICPSALVLSVLPSLAPRQVRKRYDGRYPLPLKIVYLISQLASYPIVVEEAILRRGAVTRFAVKKRVGVS